MVFISTLAVQLIIALFLSQIVHAVHAGIWFHAGILPAVLQGTFDRPGVSRVLGHGGERQHVLHLQLAGLWIPIHNYSYRKFIYVSILKPRR